MKKKLAVVALIIVLLPAVAYFLFPEFLFDLTRKANWRFAGLVKKEIQVDGDRIIYLEGGQGETVVLLHGFTADKDYWTQFAKQLTGDYHVVIPDVAGFGESTKRFDENYNIDSQVKRLDRFAELLHLERFHLAGNSGGGMVAAVYAARFPQKISTLALLAPYVGPTAKETEFFHQAKTGVNLFLISSPDQFEKLLCYLFVKPPPIPGAFKKVLADRLVAAREFNEKIWKDVVVDERMVLDPYLPMIQAPVCIIWGDKDRILDVSDASILEKDLKNHQTVIMKETGHVPMVEKPAETAAVYVNFLKKERGIQSGKSVRYCPD
jgi:pimeloyl-ACP methyl ester carboxylesterase